MKDVISNRRKELGYTQQQLAEKLQVSDKVVSKWETGRSLPDTSILLDLAKVLEIPISDLLNGEGMKKRAIKEISDKEKEIGFKNLFIITLALELIAAILMVVGRIFFHRMQDDDASEIVCYVLMMLAILVEIGTVTYYLVTRNTLLDKYSIYTGIDKKYINILLLFTYIIVIGVSAIFIACHGLEPVERLTALLIFGILFSIPFIICYSWNKKRKN